MNNGKDALTTPHGAEDSAGTVILAPGSKACPWLRTPQECAAAGLDWRTAPWVWKVVLPDGSEQMLPATATLRMTLM